MPGLVVINTLPGDHFESVEEKLSENIRALTRTQMQTQTKSTFFVKFTLKKFNLIH